MIRVWRALAHHEGIRSRPTTDSTQWGTMAPATKLLIGSSFPKRV